MYRTQAIGVFDSGSGGLSMLAVVRKQLPREHFMYLADSANAPYGTKSVETVEKLTLAAVRRLAEQGIKALVVACNTATAAAINALRETYDFPVFGIEPALMTAAESRDKGKILVMATPLTINSSNYKSLYSRYGQHAISLPCPGLMEFVEREELDSPDLHAYLHGVLASYKNETIDSVVLGCTHYLFLKKALRQHLAPDTKLLDGKEGLANQLIRSLAEQNLLTDQPGTGSVDIISTGDQTKLHHLQRMWALAQELF